MTGPQKALCILAGEVLGLGIAVAVAHELSPVVTVETRALPANVATNRRLRAAWEASKRPVEEANAPPLAQENARRAEANQALPERWRKESAAAEDTNRVHLDEANTRIRAENLVIREKNRNRGRIEVVDIGSFEPVPAF
jgi:hypothetical protein